MFAVSVMYDEGNEYPYTVLANYGDIEYEWDLTKEQGRLLLDAWDNREEYLNFRTSYGAMISIRREDIFLFAYDKESALQ